MSAKNPLEHDFDPIRRVVAQIGIYIIQLDPLVHVPYGLFRVYIGKKYIGGQISMPSLTDCQWLHHEHGVYAKKSAEPIGFTEQTTRRRLKLAA